MSATKCRLIAAVELSGTGKQLRKSAPEKKEVKSTIMPDCSFTFDSWWETSSDDTAVLCTDVIKDGSEGWEVALEYSEAISEISSASPGINVRNPSKWRLPAMKMKPWHILPDRPFTVKTAQVGCDESIWYKISILLYLIVPPCCTLSLSLQKARLQGGLPKTDAVLCAASLKGKTDEAYVEVPVHRLVLSAHSAVFAAMFAGDFTEAVDGRVLIKDEGVSLEAVVAFVEFLYSQVYEEKHDLELQLLQLADKYQVMPLVESCKLSLWLACPRRALSLLLESSGSPLVTINMRRRWIRTVGSQLHSVLETPEWEAIKNTPHLTQEIFLELFASQMATGEWQTSDS